ncbi:hypothetical protein LWI28_005180 [Acer negundo]|uniref:C3H1-type domain-containing protein n=1 Tax=Acer negundo TaxID=4023 RepID=A0AAD5JG46_ACENE|nr:hypothetical protein LWI28_005180 [Acer negundo]KAK4858121.1 hypothetical protein QYF36_011379 [Acer negundo]
MPTSSAAAAAAADDEDDQDPSEVSASDTDNDEEIVQVEEEGFDDLSDSPNDRNDVSKGMESEGHHSHLASGCSTQGNSKVRLPSDFLAVGESSGYFRTPGASNEPFMGAMGQKEELGENHEDSKYPKSGKPLTLVKDNSSQEYEISTKDAGDFQKVKTLVDQNELHTNGEALFYSSESVDADTTSTCGVTRKDVVIATPIQDRVDEGTVVVQGSEEEITKMDLHLGDDKRRRESRSPMIRPRSLVPDVESDGRNKRPAAICDFFSKGWCIRGNSCKFLHVKDGVDITTQQHAGDVAAATLKRKALIDEEMILPQELGESKSLPQLQENQKLSLLQKENVSLGNPLSSQKLASSNDNSGFTLSFKDTGRESPRENWPADDFGNFVSPINRCSFHISRSSLLPEYRSSSSGSTIPSNNYNNENPSSYSSILEGRTCIQSQYRHNDYFSLSGSETEKPLLSTDYKTKISSNDWKPSVPFRPSFFIPPAILSSVGSQYDPLCDSFDLPNTRDISFKLSFSNVGASTLNTSSHQQINGDSILSRTIVPESNGDISSASFHGASNENVLENDFHTPGKDPHTAGAEAVETSLGDGQNGTMPKGDEPSVSTHAKAISKSKTCVGRHQNDGSRHNKDIKVGRVRQNNEIDLERKTEGDVCKESKPMRHLRADLVDLVKELLKPAWSEGHLSKDVYKTIVKKAVDKVLSTLQPHQIPTTIESARQYLSSSQPKIAKLVEGYADKYGKS